MCGREQIEEEEHRCLRLASAAGAVLGRRSSRRVGSKSSSGEQKRGTRRRGEVAGVVR